MENYTENINSNTISPKLKDDLAAAAYWARIIAISGMVTSLISAVVSISRGLAIAYVTGFISLGLSALIYIFLLKFGMQIKKAFTYNNQQEFNAGLDSLKTYFQIISLLLIIVFGVCLIIFLFAMVFAMLKH
jgi:hypothetical protein